MPVNEQTMQEMFEEICKIELEDDVTFSFRSIGEIREEDVYTRYCISLSVNYPPMAVLLKLDITTGDKITPKEIEYQFKLVLEDRSISMLAHNLETIMAENWRQLYPEVIRIPDREIATISIYYCKHYLNYV